MTNADILHRPVQRALAYAYVYTAQVRSPEVANQVLAGRRLAEREGRTIIKTEIDGGRNTSKLSQREGLQRVLTAAGEGKFDTLIIQSTDRLSRNPMDLMGVITQLWVCGVEILSVSEGVVDARAVIRLAINDIWEGRADPPVKRAVTADRSKRNA